MLSVIVSRRGSTSGTRAKAPRMVGFVAEITGLAPPTRKHLPSEGPRMSQRKLPTADTSDRRTTESVVPMLTMDLEVLSEIMARGWCVFKSRPRGSTAVELLAFAGRAKGSAAEQRADPVRGGWPLAGIACWEVRARPPKPASVLAVTEATQADL